MSNLLLEITLLRRSEKSDQSAHVSAVNSKKYDGVSFTLNPMEAGDALLGALEDTYLPVEFPLAFYLNTTGNHHPTFPFTRLISPLVKKTQKYCLNIQRCTFSFSKYNAKDLRDLNWPTLQTLELNYYSCRNEKILNAEQQKKDDEEFFNNLAMFIARNQSITKLNFNNYSFHNRENFEDGRDTDYTKSGFGSYFPYLEYRDVNFPRKPAYLDEPTLVNLQAAFIKNYSLLELDPQEWQVGPFAGLSDYNRRVWLNKSLTQQLQQSLQEFSLEMAEIRSCSDFFQAIIRRNQAAAKCLRDAAREDDISMVKKMLAKGVSTNGKGEQGNTALHYVAQTGNIEIAKLLKNKQADWRVPNASGVTPVQIAQQNDHYPLASLLQGKKIEPKLLATNNLAEKNIAPTNNTFADKVAPIMARNSLYPTLTNSNSTQTESKCPIASFMEKIGLFKQSKPVEASKPNLMPPINNIVTLKNIPTKSPSPKLTRGDATKELAEIIINGTINGLDAVVGATQFSAFGPLEGICADANFNPDSNKNLTGLIEKVLKSVRQPWENITEIQKQCLIRHFAAYLQTSLLYLKDSKNLETEIIINNRISVPEIMLMLKNATHEALIEANQLMTSEQQQLNMQIQSYLPTPSAPPLEESSQPYRAISYNYNS